MTITIGTPYINTCSALINVTANLTQTENTKCPMKKFSVITVYAVSACFLLHSTLWPFNDRYVQQKKCIVGNNCLKLDLDQLCLQVSHVEVVFLTVSLQ